MGRILHSYLDVLKGKKFRVNHNMGKHTVYQINEIYTYVGFPNTDLHAKVKIIESNKYGNILDSDIELPLYELLAGTEIK